MAAQDLIAKFPALLSASKAPQIEQLLYYLQQRGSSATIESNSESRRGSDTSIAEGSMDKLPEYIAQLYEDTAEKVSSTRALMHLAKVPDNLAAFASNGN
jgi:hypothetical protein